MPRLLAPALTLLVLTARAPAAAPPMSSEEPQEAFEGVVREYLSFHLYFHPVRATELGIHDYDGRLPDLSQEGLFSLIAAHHQWLERVRRIERASLAGEAYWDHRILEHQIRHRLLELEEIRAWERNPLLYVDLVARALEPLATGRFGTDPERLSSVIARERQIPELLRQARANLLNPPRVVTELAVESARGTIRYLRDDLPRAFEGVPPGEARDRFRRINRQTIEELRSFAAWLEDDLLPRSRGEFALGGDLVRRLLLTAEHVDTPVEELLALSREEADRYDRWLESEAREVDPSRSPAEILRGVAPDVPGDDELLELADDRIQEARAFSTREDLLTLPEAPVPTSRRAPPFHLGPTASLNASGPFEDEDALVPRLQLELPERHGSEDRRRAHLGHLAPPALLGVVLRETYPGRWVQALFLRDVPSRLRRVFQPTTLTEGWGLYAEEMALDQGLGDGDPVLRIAQLRSALVALGRLEAALRMHVEGASVREGARILEERGRLDPFEALRQARRLAVDPIPGSAALGKLQISRLRADYQEHLSEEGETYVLANFHDRFLRIGAPVTIARRILIPGDERSPLPDQ